MKSKSERANFNFSRGINTDASLTAFPLNFTVDEENFELMQDGSRRRRRGLTSVARSTDLPYYYADYVYKAFKWSAVGGDTTLNFIVIQSGTELLFFEDVYPITSNFTGISVALMGFAANPDVTSDQIAASPLDAAVGKGKFIITGKYIKPTSLEYISATNTLAPYTIQMEERDFEGFIDNIADTVQVLNGEQTDQLIYNLHNAGWSASTIAQFVADTGRYPSKNLAVYLAYQRATSAGVYDADGIKAYSTDKLLAELFTDARAPVGHVIRPAFDTQTIPVKAGAVNRLWSVITPLHSGSYTAGVARTITLESVAHTLTTGDLLTIETQYNYWGWNTGTNIYDSSDGEVTVMDIGSSTPYTVTVISADRITIDLIPTQTFTASADLVATTSINFYASAPYTFSSTTGGEVCPYRPTTCAWFMGRMWYAGIDYKNWSGKIYFSQIVEADAQFGKCYQTADPTNPDISDLVASDGGTFNIPEAGKIYKLLPYSSSLLVFAEQGIWQIGPGTDGYFTATSYSIRKISEIGATGPANICIADGIPMYWGHSSIYAITTDLRQGFLVVTNVSAGIIDTLYQSISAESKLNAYAVYDDLKKRLLWYYNSPDGDMVYASNIANTVLVYDINFKAFTKWRLYIDSLGGAPCISFSHRAIDVVEAYKKIIVVGLFRSHTPAREPSGIYIFNNITDFTDNYGPLTTGGVDLSGEAEAYLLTGYDVAGVPDKFKYAPVIHTFMKKTETGYTEDGPVGESSLTMQARWDWADNSSAGKWGTAQECYRHRRWYVPSYPLPSDSFNDGQPLVVARNKVRGRGRALHLKFQAGVGKDAHIVGWTTNFNTLTDD